MYMEEHTDTPVEFHKDSREEEYGEYEKSQNRLQYQ